MRRNPLFAAVGVALGLVLFAVIVVLPRGREVGVVRDEVAGADARVAALDLQLAELEATPPADVADRAAALRAQIPSTAGLEKLLGALTDAADRSGVSFGGVTLSAGAPTDASGVTAIPVSLTASGQYFDLARFLFELEHLERLVRVSGFTLAAGDGGLTMSVTGNVYTTDPSVGPGTDPAPGAAVGS